MLLVMFLLSWLFSCAPAEAAKYGGRHSPGWNGLLPPSSVDAASDDFADSSLDAKWNEFDPAGVATWTEGADRLQLVQTSDAGSMSGLAELAPAHATYTASAHLYLGGRSANFAVAGIFAAENAISSPSTASFVVCGIQLRGSGNWIGHFESWDDYNSFTTQHFAADDGGIQGEIYVRLYIDTTGNTYSCELSETGLTWWALGPPITQGATTVSGDPVTIGVFGNNTNNTADEIVYFDLFRVDSTSDPALPMGDWQ